MTGLSRRQLGGVAAAALLSAARPRRAAAAEAVSIGFVHPVTGALAASGTLCRAGARYAVEDWNAAGGFKSLNGALASPIWSDSQSRPELVASEMSRIHETGGCGVVGAFSSALSVILAQSASQLRIPAAIDVGTADSVLHEGAGMAFRFSPPYGSFVDTGIDNLQAINDAAGKPCRTVVLVHEDSLFGTTTSQALADRLPKAGFEVLDVIAHATPTRDFTNIALRIRKAAPDIVMPSSYYAEDALLMTSLRQQRVRPKSIYHILGGAASSYRFVQNSPAVAEGIIDTTDWFDPHSATASALKARVEKDGMLFTYEVFLNYATTHFLFDAIDRAGSKDPDKITAAMAASTWQADFLPYGPTRMVNGQNTGARPVNTQVLNGAIELIFPGEYASAKPVFPVPSSP